jgi:hypothetical protein
MVLEKLAIHMQKVESCHYEQKSTQNGSMTKMDQRLKLLEEA